MRENRWSDVEAARWIDAARDNVADRALAERVYSSRLIGSDPDLVMHGGGNTSIKLKRPDLLGVLQSVIHIKGSGWDLDSLEAPGMPGVRLDPLRELRSLDRLSDEEMVNVQRSNLLNSSAPNPSVETLLHAFLPQRVVDHTHATAFLALANLPEAEAAVREIFGGRLAVVPYIMPGFALAKEAAGVFDANPDVEGLVLLKHGHFTWGETPRESYERVIDHTNLVEAWLRDMKGGRAFAATVRRDRMPISRARALSVLPNLRGAVARARPVGGKGMPKPVIFDVRSSDEINAFLRRDDLPELARRGVSSPDHVIRTKGEMLWLASDRQEPAMVEAAVSAFADNYIAFFAEQNARVGESKTMLEPAPCVAWVDGVGIVGMGKSAGVASVIGDLAEQTVEVMTLGEAAGGFFPIGQDDLFDMEYWSLEQAKLGKSSPKAFEGQIVLVTGAASGIGLATAQAFANQGAALVLADRDGHSLEAAVESIGADCLAVETDLTEPGAADDIVAEAVLRFGGVDLLVSNAGYAPQGMLSDLEDEAVRASFELNFFAHLSMARAAASVMCRQGIGGQLLFNVSKQAVNPGKGFGAYGLPKATTLFLVKQLALEFGAHNIRVNGINADRIRTGLLTDDFVKARAAARGVSEDSYMRGNLLGREVEARHVAEAFVALAKMERTTAHILTVDGGNIEASLR
ncbi:MAG: bifunctional aldolase/short-chain dehydrogenase [Pseudomonadota bacterium]